MGYIDCWGYEAESTLNEKRKRFVCQELFVVEFQKFVDILSRQKVTGLCNLMNQDKVKSKIKSNQNDYGLTRRFKKF